MLYSITGVIEPVPHIAMRQLGGSEASLIGLSAATAAYRAASRDEAGALIESVDWDTLAQELRRRRLLALLGERIGEIAGRRAPESFHAATRAAITTGSEQDAWLELILIQVAEALVESGIPSLPLKGPLLGRAIYGVAGRRFSSDIDVLVAREDLSAAAEAVQRLGYRAAAGVTPSDQIPRLHLRLERPGLPVLELHWRVHWYESRFSPDLLSHSREVRGSVRRAAPIDELTSLLLFYARDGFVDLRLASDLAAWWDTCGPQLDHGALEEQVNRYPELERALLAATRVAEQVVKLPSTMLLARPHRLERRVRFAISLNNPDARGSTHQHAAEKHLVDWLLAPDGGHWEAIRRQVDDASGPDVAPVTSSRQMSALHAARLLPRYALATFRVVLADRKSRPAPGSRYPEFS